MPLYTTWYSRPTTVTVVCMPGMHVSGTGAGWLIPTRQRPQAGQTSFAVVGLSSKVGQVAPINALKRQAVAKAWPTAMTRQQWEQIWTPSVGVAYYEGFRARATRPWHLTTL